MYHQSSALNLSGTPGARLLLFGGMLGLLAGPAAAQVVLNEVVYNPAAAGVDDGIMSLVRVELYNAGDSDVTLVGWTLSNRSDLTGVPIPDCVLPARCFLTLYFGPGTDDWDFADGAGEYYYGGTWLSFDSEQDECGLYCGPPAGSTIVDFVAWDATGNYIPGAAHDLAVSAGIWPAGAAVDTHELEAGDSLARFFDGFDRNLDSDWHVVPLTLYVHSYAFPVENPIQKEPANRAVFSSPAVTFEWTEVPGATGYDLQVATDYQFAAPNVVLEVLNLSESHYTPADGLPDNAYFWRVRAHFGADETPWAAEWLVVVNTSLREFEQHLCRDCPFKFQRKDTHLLCLWNDLPAHGESRPGCPETGPCAWDKPHPDQSPADSGCAHGRNYCWAASTAMVNARYGGDLSQDRIAYEHWHTGRPEPEGDLGHDRPIAIGDLAAVVSWALNGAAINYQYPGVGGFTFNQMKQWIDERECFVAAVPGHALVPAAYFEYTSPLGSNIQIVYANDPWIGPNHPHVFSYVIGGAPAPYWRRHRTNAFMAVWLQPTSGVTARMQETSVITDGDGDGVMDFDEDPRALECSPTNADTDHDQVRDKDEIRNYTFHDKHHRGHDNDPLWFSDYDGDGRRSENDCDSDDDGDFDGGEDIDGNGHNPDAGETCMFTRYENDIQAHVDKSVYWVGEAVFLTDMTGRRTRTYHASSRYWYEKGAGCPDRTSGESLGHSDFFDTTPDGRALTKLVDICPAEGQYYLTVDILDDGLYSEPDNWDPQTCWWCITGYPPVPSYPVPTTPITPGCPSTPVMMAAPDTYDPDGTITRWVWQVNNRIWQDGDIAEVTLAFPPGRSVVTLTVYDNDELSASASSEVYVEGGLPPPALIPLGEQINLYDPADPRYDAITVEEPAQLEFVQDNVDRLARVLPGASSYWTGPVVDLPLACFNPVDIFGSPFVSVRFTARYFVEPTVAAFGLPTVYMQLRDSQGYVADLGPVWTPDPLDPFSWAEVEAQINLSEAEELFDPAQVTQVAFYGQGLYVEEGGSTGLEFFDVRDLYVGRGAPPFVADCNGDLMIDWTDWLVISGCLTGPDYPASSDCDCADVDQDADADLSDMALFQRQFGFVIPPR